MPTYYVDSNATAGANDGTSKSNAFLTLAQAEAVVTAGDIVYISDLHSEIALDGGTFDFTPSFSAPVYLISLDFVNDTPKKGAKLKCAASSYQALTFNVAATGILYLYGIILQSGDGNLQFQTNIGALLIAEECDFTAGAAVGKLADMYFGPNGVSGSVRLINCNLVSYDDGGGFNGRIFIETEAKFEMYGGSWSAYHSSTGSGIISEASSYLRFDAHQLIFTGVDFTGSLAEYLHVSKYDSIRRGQQSARFLNCKLPARITPDKYIKPTNERYSVDVDVLYSDPGDLTAAPYKFNRAQMNGYTECLLTHYRQGGASDGEQANEYSIKVTSRPDSTFKGILGMEVPLSVFINDADGEKLKTFTVELAHSGVGDGSGGLLETDQCWLDLTGPSAEVTPTSLGHRQRTRVVDDLTQPPSDIPTSTASWSGANPLLTHKQKLSVSYVPFVNGLVHLTLHFAPGGALEKSIFVCPKIEVTP
tara:strand:- start:11 stop:1441 length:1431 start_codon:yes stop_codon:yes gene_type:complete